MAASKQSRDATRPRKVADSDDTTASVPAYTNANGNGGYIQLKHLEKIRLQPKGALACCNINVGCATLIRLYIASEGSIPQSSKYLDYAHHHVTTPGAAKFWVFVHCTDLYLESERAFALFCHSMAARTAQDVDVVAAAFDMITCSNGESFEVTAQPQKYSSRIVLLPCASNAYLPISCPQMLSSVSSSQLEQLHSNIARIAQV